jgi:cytochrome c-type biogenesis protein
MFDSIFITVNEWISSGPALAAVGCFFWGMISVVFSPCHLASIPLIVAYVGGQETAVKPRQAAWYAGAFSLGLFITIAAVGVACLMLGRMLGDIGVYWQVLVGAVLVQNAANEEDAMDHYRRVQDQIKIFVENLPAELDDLENKTVP